MYKLFITVAVLTAGVSSGAAARALHSVPPFLSRTPSAAAAAAATTTCWPEWGAGKRTVLFVADPGTFSGAPEALVYLNNLKSNAALAASASGCPRVDFGAVMRQPVAVVTTGINEVAAAGCVYELLLRCGARIKDAFFSGTSGWSPQLGGILNNGTCEAGRANGNGKVTRLGDVCVSPFAVNWACRKASWAMTSAGAQNQCTFPQQEFNALTPELFGQCTFTSPAAKAGLALSDEVIRAAPGGFAAHLPQRPAKIAADEAKFWGNMKAGTKAAYPTVSADALPKVWTYKQCMEISSPYFWSGAPWDMVARKYVADALTASGIGGVVPYTQADVLAVSAMEAIGVASAFEKYSKLAGGRTIPYTIVRGMSNWAVQPVALKGTVAAAAAAPSHGGDAQKAAPPRQIAMWGEGEEVPEDFVNGYKYAIQSASTAVMSALQARCVAGGGSNKTDCTFSV